MTAKIRINITVDVEVHRKAHELGLNVSKVCENALKEAVRRLERPKTETNGGTNTQGSFLGESSFTKEGSWWAGPDLNRRSSPREGDVPWPFVVSQLDHRPLVVLD
jgi:post-segregation antitoxin (ccd killing protein)